MKARRYLFGNRSVRTFAEVSRKNGISSTLLLFSCCSKIFRACSDVEAAFNGFKDCDVPHPQSLPQARSFARCRLHHSDRTSSIAVTATTANEASCCQSISASQSRKQSNPKHNKGDRIGERGHVPNLEEWPLPTVRFASHHRYR